ncbi:hypothetical protein BURPS1710A_A1208 [Burkholderia pseudomallei 1710a]|uniref:Uncharacterized protein n=1 Tax=Burkholderia pseudomallei 1710a TaxID=320371 RepID=A0A0E1VUY7_BURPE|nr:hypothetical protein BURPS1710A_A1208 [Burkholderia pseudomallei 1710a]
MARVTSSPAARIAVAARRRVSRPSRPSRRRAARAVTRHAARRMRRTEPVIDFPIPDPSCSTRS